MIKNPKLQKYSILLPKYTTYDININHESIYTNPYGHILTQYDILLIYPGVDANDTAGYATNNHKQMPNACQQFAGSLCVIQTQRITHSHTTFLTVEITWGGGGVIYC